MDSSRILAPVIGERDCDLCGLPEVCRTGISVGDFGDIDGGVSSNDICSIKMIVGGDDEKIMLRSNFWPMNCHLHPSSPNTFGDLSPRKTFK